VVVTSFVNYFEGDGRFSAAAAVYVVTFKLLHVEILHDDFEVSVEMM
jgi:hypothetical protein